MAGSTARALLLASMSFLTAAAQPSDTPTPEPEPTPPPGYNLALRFYTWPVKGILHGDMNVPSLPPAYLQGTNGVERVVLARAGMSAPVVYRGPNPPVLITPVRAAGGENGPPGRIERRVLAAPDIPPEWRQAVVILFPESKRPDGSWTTIPIPASRLELPEGASRFMNTTPKAVVLEVDGNRQSIPPGQTTQLPSGGGGDRIRVRLYARDRNGEVRLLYTASHWNRREKGNLYLIYPEKGDRFRVLQMSTEDLAPPTPTPAP